MSRSYLFFIFFIFLSFGSYWQNINITYKMHRNVVMSLNYLWDEVGHQERVRAHVRKHATNSRDKWREQIISTT